MALGARRYRRSGRVGCRRAHRKAPECVRGRGGLKSHELGRVVSTESATWRLEGYDTFDGTYYLMGTLKRADGSTIDGMQPSYSSYEAAYADAAKALADLERTQPSASSGGQAGIQDRVFIVHPGGRRERVWPGVDHA
jgi:hypothetical protein